MCATAFGLRIAVAADAHDRAMASSKSCATCRRASLAGINRSQRQPACSECLNHLISRPEEMLAARMLSKHGAEVLARGNAAVAAGISGAAKRRLLLTVVINLDGSPERMETMVRQLATARISWWVRLPALYGADVSPQHLHGAGLLMNGRKARTDVASALSHLVVWHGLASANASGFILEDDAILRPRLLPQLSWLLRAAGDNWDILHLTYFNHLTRPACVHPLRVLPPGGASPSAALVVGPDARAAGLGEPLWAPVRMSVAAAARLVQLRCQAGLNPSVTAYLMTARGARKALSLTIPLNHTVDLQLGRGSPRLRWLALRRDHWLARHNWSVRSVRVHGLRPPSPSRRRVGPPPPPSPSHAPRRLHVVAFSTPETASQLRCWQQWLERMSAADTLYEYVLHVNPQASRQGVGTSIFGGRSWVRAVRAKVPFVLSTLQALAQLEPSACVVVTDLDVIPLRPLSQLLAVDWRRHAEMWFMTNHRARPPAWNVFRRDGFAYRDVVNTGLLLITNNTPAVRTFVQRWSLAIRARNATRYQPLANWLLGCGRQPRAHAPQAHGCASRSTLGFDFRLFPPPLVPVVCGNSFGGVTARAIVFHAICGRGTAESKAYRMKEALTRSGSTMIEYCNISA